jgi:hypothetical protein
MTNSTLCHCRYGFISCHCLGKSENRITLNYIISQRLVAEDFEMSKDRFYSQFSILFYEEKEHFFVNWKEIERKIVH